MQGQIHFSDSFLDSLLSHLQMSLIFQCIACKMLGINYVCTFTIRLMSSNKSSDHLTCCSQLCSCLWVTVAALSHLHLLSLMSPGSQTQTSSGWGFRKHELVTAGSHGGFGSEWMRFKKQTKNFIGPIMQKPIRVICLDDSKVQNIW